jgi:hypothetical protein
MSDWFANPAGLWAALLLGPLMLLYMLRHRPVRRRVPSTLLWKGVAQAQVSTSPFQRLRRSLSLLLMIAATASLTFAIAGLRVPGGTTRGLPLVVIIDTTASMGASDGGQTRLDAARELARRAIAAAGNAEVTLLAWDGTLKAVGAPRGPADAAISGLGSITVSPHGAEGGGVSRALRQLAAEGDSTVVFIGDLDPGVGDGVVFLQSGASAPNFAIVTAGTREPAPGKLEINFGIEAFETQAPERVTLALERISRSGPELIDARDVTLAPLQRTAVNFRVDRAGLYRGVLRVADALSLDDEAWVRCVPLPVLRVAPDASVPGPVLRALSAIEHGIGSIRIGQPAPDAAYVLAGPESGGARTRLPAAYIGPDAAPPEVSYGARIEASATLARPMPGPLWRGAGTPDVLVRAAWPIQHTSLVRPLLEVDGGTAIALCERKSGLRDLVIGMPLGGEEAGTFIDQPAFVIFWSNWFDYVRELIDPLPRGAQRTRDTVRVHELEGRSAFRVVAPDDRETELEPGAGVALRHPGVYRFSGLEGEVPLIGASLLDPEESSLSVTTGHDNDATLSVIAEGSGLGGAAALDLAPWLALLGAALLLTEWALFRRRFPRRNEASPTAAALHSPATLS